MRITLLCFLLLCCAGQASAQTSFEVSEAGILELQAALETNQVTSVELVQQYLDRIAAYDRQGPMLNSLVRINPQALEVAAALDAERRQNGARGPLHGVPVIVKDNYNTTFMPTTGGSVALAGFIPDSNASQVDRLIEAGAIVLAKANLHEYAYGITSIGSLVGQTRNPYDPRRVPGGSSGGTGAAVAASLGAVGMGSDTCGSIRIPSAFNNLVGLRPSKGLSSIWGIMPLSHTQDMAGPLARNVSDLAIVLDATAGFDPRDPATAIMADRPAPQFLAQLESASLDGLRIGRLVDYFERADAAVARVIEEKLALLAAAGATIVATEIPQLDQLIAGSGLIGHEFRNDLDDYLATFGSDRIDSLAAIVDQGLYHEAVQGALGRSRSGDFDAQAYQTAYTNRTVLRSAIEQAMSTLDLDVLVYPPIAELPVFTGLSQPGNNCSIAANSGLPAISLPAGFSADGLPVGMELLGSFLDDVRLVSLAYRIEQLSNSRLPPATTPALIGGRAPEPLLATLSFRQAGIELSGQLSFDVTTSRLSYQLDNRSGNSSEVYAVTLLIDRAPVGELNDPQVQNLLPPDVDAAAGEIPVGPDLRAAIQEQNLYVRVFGVGLPAAGIVMRLQFSR